MTDNQGAHQAKGSFDDYVHSGGLWVAPALHETIANHLAPGTGVLVEDFFSKLAGIVAALGTQNDLLLHKRDQLQKRLDDWHSRHPGDVDLQSYEGFLRDIGYLLPQGPAVPLTDTAMDAEISHTAGPQLVVPVDNARYAINAANARWGSLFDAVYGSDLIPDTGATARGDGYNAERGADVVKMCLGWLDQFVPWQGAAWCDVHTVTISPEEAQLCLVATTNTGREVRLTSKEKFVGFRGPENKPTAVLLANNGLHIELVFGAPGVDRTFAAGLRDVIMEAAVTTIADFEDSVAAVDADDKSLVYKNWSELIRGRLCASFEKNGQRLLRRLNADRAYTGRDGETFSVAGRSLLLARNVGLHMYTDDVRTPEGKPIPEGFLDIMATALGALPELTGRTSLRNSRAGNLYVVKPKLHGPEEVAFTVRLFAMVEEAFDLPSHSIKLGIMDEERRTSINLPACIKAAQDRLAFINTGFLDRTGDEIHSVMEAGAVMRKADMKTAPWFLAYETWNVDVGLRAGLGGRAQIGKGMWAMPDAMAAMMSAKQAHPEAGASTAWVPSPTAATLHAIHYHCVDVAAKQKQICQGSRAFPQQLLHPPLLMASLAPDQVTRDLEANCQAILGYVSRWIEHGVGCSKIPDAQGVGLMEDRATLRISSQHIANWLHHNIVTRDQVLNAFDRMARVVDQQNQGDKTHARLSSQPRTAAFLAAIELVTNGRAAANGYTEPVLHRWRRLRKQEKGSACA